MLLLFPVPGMPGGHPSVVGCHPRESYQSLLCQANACARLDFPETMSLVLLYTSGDRVVISEVI